MKRACTVLAVGAILCALAISAYGAPSLGGYTGLLFIPNADALSKGSFNVGYVHTEILDLDVNNFFLNYGIDAGQQAALEIGVNVARGDNSERSTYINAKCTFQRETMGKTGVAAGVIDATGTDKTTLYVVGSKVLERGPTRVFGSEIQNPRAHFGIAGGGLDGFFAGLSAGLGNRLTVMAEYDSENVNVGARAYIHKGLGAEIGWLDIGGRDDIGLGAFYSVSY